MPITAKFIKTIIVTDPATGSEVGVCIYKEETGGIFGIDASFIEHMDDGEVIQSVFSNGEVELID